MEYSSSTNGTTWSSWTTATNTLGGKRTYYKFALPQTSQIYKIKFRVSYTDHNGVVKQATSGVMDVIKEVFISSATNTNNTTSLQWNAVTGASGYEVFYLKKEPSPALSHWESLGTTTSTNFSFPQVIGANDEPRVMVKTIAPDGTRSIPSISRQVLITDHCVTPEELTFSHRITSTGGVKTLIVAINVDAEINYTPPTYTVTLTNIYDPSDVITATLTNPSVSVGNWGSAPTIASNVEYSMVIPNNKYYSIKVSMNCSNGYTVESPHTEVVYASIGGAYCCTGSNGLANISKITMNTNIHNSTVFSCSIIISHFLVLIAIQE
jgi:hypothetical protein